MKNMKTVGLVAAMTLMTMAGCSLKNQKSAELVQQNPTTEMADPFSDVKFDREREALGLPPEMDRAQAMFKIDSTKQAIGITPDMYESTVLSKLDSTTMAPLFQEYGIPQPPVSANPLEKLKALGNLITARQQDASKINKDVAFTTAEFATKSQENYQKLIDILKKMGYDLDDPAVVERLKNVMSDTYSGYLR